MKFLRFSVAAILCSVAGSCTLDKTDYEVEIERDTTEYFEFKEVTSVSKGNYKISIEALNGTFYKGYNEVRLKISNIQTNANIETSEVTFLPIMTDAEEKDSSCPHSYNLVYKKEEKYYSGYSVFTSESNPMETWHLHLQFTADGQEFSVIHPISVHEQTNKNLNMTSFTGTDGEQYFIALISPQKPNVSENKLVAGIYKYLRPTEDNSSPFSYTVVNNHKLLLDPRMPEPSMGNHSSPNNQDLTQQSDGLYHGVVNYTMTGNWTLNFILLDSNEKVIKGTEVSTDFTPGIHGAKSELYIDTLF
jgi:hypothetical protein